MTLQGVLRRDDLGPGVWVLVADDGREWTLDGDVPAHLAGMRVRAEGDPAESVGFAMIGRVFSVSDIRSA